MLIDLENNGPFGIGLYITRENTDFNMMMTVSYYLPGQGFTSFPPLLQLVESGDKKRLFTVLSDFTGSVADPADPASFQPMLREDLEVAAVSAPLAGGYTWQGITWNIQTADHPGIFHIRVLQALPQEEQPDPVRIYENIREVLQQACARCQ
ncbi:MAG: hypothetical protein ACUVTU_11095 [Desulfurispora sp.]|uniref:hypothetical protein n=1 Tax=Desulfurispora sp. TaxID=3014275 RepID=UPI004049267B